jgi:hypothetical protein
MPANSDVIKEFLVSLGWVVNEPGLRRFTGAIENVSLKVVALGAAAGLAAVKVVSGVEAIAEQFEQLYYASQRIGASAQNIAALDYAARQIGLSAGDARQALEGMAAQLRTNPGTEGFLNSLGVQTRTVSGGMRDATKVLDDFLGRLRQQPYFVAVQMASVLGISERTLFQMLRYQEEARRQQDRYRFWAARLGIDLDDASRKSVDFMRGLRELSTIIELVGSKWSIALLPYMDDFIRITIKVIGWAERLGHAVVALDRYLQGSPTSNAMLRDLYNIMEAIVDLMEGRWRTAWNRFAPDMLKIAPDRPAGGYSFQRDVETAPARENEATAARVAAYFRGRFAPHQVAGILANISAESGFDPQARGDNGAAFGIAQWRGARLEALKRFAGTDDLSKIGLETQLKFMALELDTTERRAAQALRATTTASGAGETFSRAYERPADFTGEATRRAAAASALIVDPRTAPLFAPQAAAAPSVSQTNETNIHVHGVSDPDRAAQRVSREQERMSGVARDHLAEALR